MVCWPSAKQLHQSKEDKSAASFGRQVAAWVPDMFCNFYLTKSAKIANNSTNTDATRTNEHIFWNLRISEIFYVCLTKFKNNQILRNKINRRLRTQPCIGRTIPIVNFECSSLPERKKNSRKRRGKIKVQRSTSFAGATTFSTTAFSIMTLGLMGLAATLSTSNFFSECHIFYCCAVCHHAEWHSYYCYTECRGVLFLMK
jgi:hypothetical protein